MDIKNLLENRGNITISISPEELKKFGESLIKETQQRNEEKQEVSTKLITVNQVCKMLAVSRVTLWDWDKKGITDPVRLGNLKRYRLSDIEELIKNTGGENE